ncbi:MAG: stage III sporulation protein AE [Clostridia bacterium]|nr:stage III sporulation protein AE [Clostridia bacterium]
MKKIDKIQKILAFLIAITLLLLASVPTVLCEPSDTSNIQTELSETIDEQLGNIDLGSFDEIIDGLDENGQNLFGSLSFWDKVTSLLNGEFNEDYGSFFSALLDTLFGEIGNIIPILCTIIAITILCSLVGNLRSETGSESVGNIINFVCYGVVIVIITSSVFSLLDITTNCVNSLKTQMDLLFPILLTLLASVGGTVSVGIFQPTLAILSNLVVQIFTLFLIPLFIFSFVFVVVGHLTDSVKLDKFRSLFNSIFKWVAGICFSVFMGAMVVGGVVAGSFDSVSIRATKFALKSYIPILGGYLSDGFNIVMASSVLIKNAVGMAGVILAAGTVLFPIIQIAVFSLGLKLTASILEPLVKSKVPDFLMSIAKLLNMLVVILAGVGFMYMVSVGLILSTANIV